MPTIRPNNTVFNISTRELTWIGVFYVVSAILYDISISISEMSFNNGRPFSEVWVSYLPQIFVNYFFKILFTIPFWWLYFRKLKDWSLEHKAILHLFTAPIYIYITILCFYAVADAMEIPRLRGFGQIWDYYISFLLYVVQFGIFHAYSYHKNLQAQQKLEAELRQATLQSELTALKAQINPHFLYNTFNTISASLPPAQETTRELLAELADMFRYQLQASKVELVTVAEEIAFVQKYLDLEKARMGERLVVNCFVEEEATKALIPPMILQPLVENAIKHGIAPLVEGGEIAISVTKERAMLCFEMADTGVGMNKSKPNTEGIGLKNTELRLKKMLGAELKITQNTPRGTKINFEISAQLPYSSKP
ncbi:MAG: histidine kinase [Spirosomataceae bacterium]